MSDSEQDKKTKEFSQGAQDEARDVNGTAVEGAADGAQASSTSGTEEKLLQEVNEMRNKYLYLRADFENYKKQALKERSELVKYGSEPIFREFLNILDDLERATDMELKVENLESFKSGLQLIVNQFRKSFERFGLEEVPSQGQPFDPLVHEALGTQENKEMPPNSVISVFKKAYKLHGKVIRPAQVLVNSATKGE